MTDPAQSHHAPPSASAAPTPALDHGPERRHTPAAARGPYFGAVRDAWRRALAAQDPEHPALRLALAAYACDGRARGVPIETLLRALDTVVRPAQGGDAALDFGRARERAGTMLIRSYYRAD
jgi:hypothetical protein